MTNKELIALQDRAIIIADKLLPLLPDYNVFHFSYFAKEELKWNSKDVQEITFHAPYIKHFMIEQLKYVVEKTQGQLFELTDKGREAKKAGGHYAYLKKLEKEEASKRERQALNDEKLKYEVKNTKRIFKTYWITFWFAIIALIISLALAILKYLEFVRPK